MCLIAFLGFTAWDYWRVSQLYVVSTERAEAYREDTMAKVRGSVLFARQVQFAELTTATVVAAQAHDPELVVAALDGEPEHRTITKHGRHRERCST